MANVSIDERANEIIPGPLVKTGIYFQRESRSPGGTITREIVHEYHRDVFHEVHTNVLNEYHFTVPHNISSEVLHTTNAFEAQETHVP